MSSSSFVGRRLLTLMWSHVNISPNNFLVGAGSGLLCHCRMKILDSIVKTCCKSSASPLRPLAVRSSEWDDGTSGS